MVATTKEAPRQLQLPHFPAVGDRSRLRNIRPWKALGFDLGQIIIPTRLIHAGTPAPDVLIGMLHAYPYIDKVTFGQMHLRYYGAPHHTRDIVSRHVTRNRLYRLAQAEHAVEGWNKDATATGLLSRVRLRRNEPAYLPIMRFWGNDPAEIGRRVFPHYPGFVIEDGLAQGRPIHQFWGATVMSYDRWVQFMEVCRDVIRGADDEFITRSLKDGTSIVRIFHTGRRTTSAPQVVAMDISAV